jgi:hypothetical protein|tara:strand:+ start:85 stop:621 length:537 start_codon:yes stop_codon:yes gene_type:complete
MQPDPYGQPQQVMIDPNTGLPSNVIIMQQPSQAPQVVGILIIIYGVLNVLGSLLGLFGASMLSSVELDDPLLEEYSMQMMVFSLVAIVLSAVTIVSGVWINNRQTRGVHLAWVTIGLSMLMSFIQGAIIPAELTDPSGLGQMIGIVMNLVCTMICGVIVAIPLMVANSGMDQSSLIPK